MTIPQPGVTVAPRLWILLTDLVAGELNFRLEWGDSLRSLLFYSRFMNHEVWSHLEEGLVHCSIRTAFQCPKDTLSSMNHRNLEMTSHNVKGPENCVIIIASQCIKIYLMIYEI